MFNTMMNPTFYEDEVGSLYKHTVAEINVGDQVLKNKNMKRGILKSDVNNQQCPSAKRLKLESSTPPVLDDWTPLIDLQDLLNLEKVEFEKLLTAQQHSMITTVSTPMTHYYEKTVSEKQGQCTQSSADILNELDNWDHSNKSDNIHDVTHINIKHPSSVQSTTSNSLFNQSLEQVNDMSRKVPTFTKYLHCEKAVTEDQKQYARSYISAFNKLYQSDSAQEPDNVHRSTTVSLFNQDLVHFKDELQTVSTPAKYLCYEKAATEKQEQYTPSYNDDFNELHFLDSSHLEPDSVHQNNTGNSLFSQDLAHVNNELWAEAMSTKYLYFEKVVTEEQEQCARNFINTFDELHRPDGCRGADSIHGNTMNLTFNQDSLQVKSELQAVSTPTAYFCYENAFNKEEDESARDFIHPLNDVHRLDPCKEPDSLDGMTYTTLESLGSVQPITDDWLFSQDPVQVKVEPQMVPTISSSSFTWPTDRDSQERIKLERKRLRNRIAASKCRRRKLERITSLEIKVKLLKDENNDLSQMVNKLREHVSRLKEQVIDHIHSGCQIIKPDTIF